MWGYAMCFFFFIISVSTMCNDQVCVRSTRMISAEPSEQNSRPFQVALYMRVGSTGQLGFCGGSLIHTQWIITAAHCCFHDGTMVDNVQAILGAHSLYDRYENGRRIISVDNIQIHPDWDPVTFDNDLALLRLANVAQLTDTIDVVRLPYLNISNSNFAGASSMVSGWGIAGPQVTFVSPTLRGKSMTVMTNSLCNSTYFNRLPPNVVCGFSQTAGTCKGDNGGPMTFFYNATEEDILIGVATFIDDSGCNDEVPSVFTRVQNYLNWISGVTGILLV